MIRSFLDRETERIWNGERSRRGPSEIQPIARRKLRMLANATSLRDLAAPPGNRPEPLRGDRQGRHSVRLNERWRICFAWRDDEAWDVTIEDYH